MFIRKKSVILANCHQEAQTM